MLFSQMDRTYTGPKLYAESNYNFLDRSARQEAATVRVILEQWFSHFPMADQADLLGRFKSPIDVHHISAAFELYMHELFLCLGYSVEVHPTTPNAKTSHPDFLITDGEGNRIYVEAVQATDIDTEEEGARKRLNVVYDAINRLESRDWFVSVKTDSYPTQQPSGKRLRAELKRWLDSLDRTNIVDLTTQAGTGALPILDYEEGEWRLHFTAIPRSAPKRDGPVGRVLGSYSMGARWLNTWEVIRDTLISKENHYGPLDAPLIIAVNANVFDVDEIDIMQALFGQEEFLINRDVIDSEPVMRRARNGFWWGPTGPRHTEVSAVAIGYDIRPFTCGVRDLVLYQNPWADVETVGQISTLTMKAPLEGEMRPVPGRHPRDILHLPDGFPR